MRKIQKEKKDIGNQIVKTTCKRYLRGLNETPPNFAMPCVRMGRKTMGTKCWVEMREEYDAMRARMHGNQRGNSFKVVGFIV